MGFDEVMFGISPPHFSAADGLLYGHRGVDACLSTNDFDVLVDDLLRLTRGQRPVVGLNDVTHLWVNGDGDQSAGFP